MNMRRKKMRQIILSKPVWIMMSGEKMRPCDEHTRNWREILLYIDLRKEK